MGANVLQHLDPKLQGHHSIPHAMGQAVSQGWLLILCKLMINDAGCWIKSGQQETKTGPLIQWSHIISIGSPIVYTIASHSKV